MFLQNPLLYIKNTHQLKHEQHGGPAACRSISMLSLCDSTIPHRQCGSSELSHMVRVKAVCSRVTPTLSQHQGILLSNEIVYLSHKIGCHLGTHS